MIWEDLEVFAPNRSAVHHQLGLPNPYITALFPLALQNIELFCALVALCQTLIPSQGRSRPILSKQALQYRGTAIKMLQQKLLVPSPVATDAMIMTVLMLMLLEASLLSLIGNLI